MDDLICKLHGESNPHDVDHYRANAKCSMTDEEKSEALNTALYEKAFAEQEDYRAWLLSQTPEEKTGLQLVRFADETDAYGNTVMKPVYENGY